MGYFTETMNALFEMRTDIEASYAFRDKMERMSGDHEIGKGVTNLGKKAISQGVYGKKCRTLRDRTERIGKAAKSYRDNQYLNSNDIERQKSNYKKNIGGKSCKESFSEAFDSLVM